MPNGDESVISGTVIERSFVARDVATVLFAATVPLSEVSVKGNDDDLLRRTLAEMAGVPTNTIIDEVQYGQVVEYLLSAHREFRPFPYFEDWWEFREFRFRELIADMRSAERPSIRLFAEHVIALFALTAEDRLWSNDPFLLIPPTARQRGRGRLLLHDIDEDAARVGGTCVNARLARTSKVKRFTENVLQYELPFGRSPATSSDSLLKLLESGKKMCLAPIAAGGALGVTEVGQGQYVATLLSAATGSLMTLVLLSSVAVGSLLINYVAQRRTRVGSNQSHRRRER
jgi:hypothetical protein